MSGSKLVTATKDDQPEVHNNNNSGQEHIVLVDCVLKMNTAKTICKPIELVETFMSKMSANFNWHNSQFTS